MRKFVILMCVAAASASCEKGGDGATTATQTAAATTAAQTAAQPTSTKTPTEVLTAYYAAMREGQFDEAYAMVHPDDQAAKPVDMFRASSSVPLQYFLIKNRTIEVVNAKEDGDKATLHVKFTGPDVVRLQKEVLKEHMKTTKVPSGDKLKEMMLEAVKKPDAPTVVTDQEVYFTRDGSGEWRLDFDWDRENLNREMPTRTRPAVVVPDAGAAE